MKKTHGKKYFIKVVKENKEYSWRDILASWTIEVEWILIVSLLIVAKLELWEGGSEGLNWVNK